MYILSPIFFTNVTPRVLYSQSEDERHFSMDMACLTLNNERYVYVAAIKMSSKAKTVG